MVESMSKEWRSNKSQVCFTSDGPHYSTLTSVQQLPEACRDTASLAGLSEIR